MSLLTQVVGRRESFAATLSNPPDWLVNALTGGGASYSGKTVSVASSLGLVPVYSAVSLLSGAVGQLPLICYRTGEDRERAEGTRQWDMLHDQPNPEMAADELWEIATSHLNLWGNAFIAKMRAGDGRVAELWPLDPKRIQVGRKDGKRFFTIVEQPGVVFTETDILHIRGLGTDGLVGYSPIQLARQMLGNVMAMEEFQGNFWRNGAAVSSVLLHPQKLSEEANKRLAESWKGLFSGPANAGKTAILEEGMTLDKLGMPLEDAQFIETAKFNDLRVAQLFRIPPYMLGAEIGSSLTYSTTELQGIDFVRWSLSRWLKRIERSLERDPDIFPPSLGIFPEFLVDSLLRASTKERYEAHKVGIDAGFLLPSEARRKENLPVVPGIDDKPRKPAVPSPNGQASLQEATA